MFRISGITLPAGLSESGRYPVSPSPRTFFTVARWRRLVGAFSQSGVCPNTGTGEKGSHFQRLVQGTIRMRSKLGSRDPIERRDAVRVLLRRLLAEREVSNEKLGRHTDHSDEKISRFLNANGERKYSMPLADLVPLVELLGVGVLEPFARGAGYKLVPLVAEVIAPIEAMGVVADAQEASAGATSYATRALSDGVLTPSEDAELERRIDRAERVLQQLRAVRAGRVIGSSDGSEWNRSDVRDCRLGREGALVDPQAELQDEGRRGPPAMDASAAVAMPPSSDPYVAAIRGRRR